MAKGRSQSLLYALALALIIAALLYFSHGAILAAAGGFLVQEERPELSDAVVVLSTGIDYYPRLIEAARLYGEGYTKRVVINGNRKTAALRELERKGFKSCCPWHEDSMRILYLLGVPRDRVVAVSVEDAYDTVSEAKAVGAELIKTGINRILITTSRFHTKRARYIWESIFSGQLSIRIVPARDDPYSPSGWWKEGRQIRWVLAEYGAWIYYYWKMSRKID